MVFKLNLHLLKYHQMPHHHQLLMDEKLLSGLVKLGLSRDTGKCYLAILQTGSLSITLLAQAIGILPNAVYRLTQKLMKLGLIVNLSSHPQTFQAIPLPIASELLINHQTQLLEEAKITIANTYSKNTSPPQTKIDILTGKYSLFSQYVKLTASAVKEVLIISIGEPVPDNIKLVNRDLIDKGIPIKFLIHTYNESNHDLISSWVRMGLQVRHLPDSGYHLVIIDHQTSILSINNPKNTNERTSIVVHSPNLSQALENYFYTLWNQALPIKAS